MYTVSDCIAFVKDQVEYQDRRAVKTREVPSKLQFHSETAIKFRSLLEFLEFHKDGASPNPVIPTDVDPTGALMPKELVGLPQELIAELSGGGIDKQELLIIEMIEKAGGTLSLDRLLIGIYKQTGEVIKRTVMTAKLYRMAQNGMISRVPKKKGLYTTSAVTSNDPSGEDDS